MSQDDVAELTRYPVIDIKVHSKDAARIKAALDQMLANSPNYQEIEGLQNEGLTPDGLHMRIRIPIRGDSVCIQEIRELFHVMDVRLLDHT